MTSRRATAARPEILGMGEQDMRIHTAITPEEMRGILATLTGHGAEPLAFERLDHKRSRTAAHGYDLILSGNGGTGMGFSRGDYRSATWDEHGDFLAALYRLDPAARCGPYVSAEHFGWSTNDRYDGAAYDPCRHRKWQTAEVVTGAYAVAECARCGAVKRWLLGPLTWWDYSGEDRPTATPAAPSRSLAEIRSSVAELRAELGVMGPEDDPDNYGGDITARDLRAGGPMPPAAEPWTPGNRRAVRV